MTLNGDGVGGVGMVWNGVVGNGSGTCCKIIDNMYDINTVVLTSQYYVTVG